MDSLPEEAAQLAQQIEDMFEGNPAIKLLLDPDDGRIVDACSAAVLFYGYPANELRRMKIQELNQLPEELINREIQQVKEQKKNYLEFKHRLRNGEIRDMQVYSAPCRVKGRTLLFSILFDITERKRLSAQLAHAQRMEALGKMAGGIAHDFNNLLGAMEIVAGMLAMEHKDEPNVIEMQGLVRRGAAVTNQLLAFCRRQVLRAVLLDLGEVLSNARQLLQRSLGEGIALRMELPDTPAPFLGDRVQLEQVLLNLALNARDAMPGGGTLTITLEEHQDTAAQGLPPGKYWCWRVKDTGQGLSTQELSHLFEPFFSTKSRESGVGLGLSVVHGVVHQYGGTIWADSVQGQGTTFTVLLPHAPDEPELLGANPKALSPGGPSGNEQILLVEDEPVIRRVVADVLRKYGYRVVIAQDGIEALAVAAQHPEIDLLLTDVVMPRMGGCDLADALVKKRPGLRVLYMSGHQDSYSALGLLDAAEWFLAKPFSLEDLLSKVRQVLSKAPRRATPS